MVPGSVFEFYGPIIPVATLYFAAAFCGDKGNSYGNKTPYQFSKLEKERLRYFGRESQKSERFLNIINYESEKRVVKELLEDSKFANIETFVALASAVLVVALMFIHEGEGSVLHTFVMVLVFLNVLQIRLVEHWW
jgi:hypothetical protein